MGANWVVVNETKKEWADPDPDQQEGEKECVIERGDFGRILVHLMLNRWLGDRVEFLADWDHEHYPEVLDTYKNITKEALASYNTQHPDMAVGVAVGGAPSP